jgi:hypothetical protein
LIIRYEVDDDVRCSHLLHRIEYLRPHKPISGPISGRSAENYTTDEWWLTICIHLAWHETFKASDLWDPETKKKQVEDVEAGRKAWDTLSDDVKSKIEKPNEITAWSHDPKAHKVDKYGESPGSFIQLGCEWLQLSAVKAHGWCWTVFVAVLDAMLYGTGQAVKEDGKMNKDEAEQHNKELDKTLKDGKYEFQAADISKMRPSF